jgi:hypothetical protein
MPSVIVGRPKPLRDQYVREMEEVFIPCINDSTEDVPHTQADIIELINSSGETFNSDGTPVNLNDPDQSLFFIEVRSYFCDSILKMPDGQEDFIVFSDAACVLNADGVVVGPLFQGGSFILGDSDNNPNTEVVMDESVVWPCGSAGVYCIKILRIRNRNETKPVPEIIIEPRQTCFSYTNLGPTMIFGANGVFENPSLFDDPPTQAGFLDYRCTDHYPVCLEVEDAMVSTDNGATWNNLTFPPLTCYDSLAEVPFRDDGYGLGFAGLSDIFDSQLAQYDLGLKPNGGNGYVLEYGQTAFAGTHMVKIIYRFVVQGENCEGILDPYHTVWTNEWQYAGSDGQRFLTFNGDQTASGWSLPNLEADVELENCQDV